VPEPDHEVAQALEQMIESGMSLADMQALDEEGGWGEAPAYVDPPAADRPDRPDAVIAVEQQAQMLGFTQDQVDQAQQFWMETHGQWFDNADLLIDSILEGGYE
jgi:hypothetical protein